MTSKIMLLACSRIESLMHGVAYFTLKGGTLTAHYDDGTTESAEAKPETAVHFKKYVAYQENQGPEVNPPNAFALVSEIQSHR